MSDSIRLAMIGAGIFAREAHVPAIQELGDSFEIVAVNSRTEASAQQLAATVTGSAPEIVTDLDALLARDDIEAVNIVLPIQIMPQVVEQALAAGKHVISEKPVAADIATAHRLLAHPLAAGQVWMVAENWRYEPALIEMARLVREGAIGRPLHVQFAVNVAMESTNPYYGTQWRRSGEFAGGFLLDGGVHHVAALRMILGEVTGVSALVASMREDLPPADTVAAALQFENGVTGTYTASFAAGAPWTDTLYVTGSEGTLRTDRREVLLKQGDSAEQVVFTTTFQGVTRELEAFASAIRQGQPHRNPPLEAARDMAVLLAMLDSAATGKTVTPETFAR